jgi:hypothetical protein
MIDDSNEQAAPAESQSETLIERIEHAAADAVHAIEDAAKAAVHEAEHALGLDSSSAAPAPEQSGEAAAAADEPQAVAAAPAPTQEASAAAPSRPQVGDAVLFWPHAGYPGSFPIEAEIDHVWSDTCVNVSMPASDGSVYQPTSVFLVRHGNQAQPSGYYCAYADELPDAAPAVKAYEVVTPALRQDLQQLHDVAVDAAAEARAEVAAVAQQATAAYADGEGIIRIEDARALPEASPDAPALPIVATIERHIESFIDSDGRVMRIVKVAGALAKKAVQAVEAAV